MANKRRVSPNEDSDEDSSAEKSPSTKRARVAGGDETQRIKNAKRGKRKANTGDDDEEAEEFDRVDVSHIIADNDEPYSPTKGSSQSRSKRTGGIRSMGVIESIEMHHFMCHPRLSFKFGPQINFIVGNNGSGKSAVLSALTVALGGKASLTGRGNGLKSFIREGESTSEVSVTIKNQGEEAFKAEVYGDSITIIRKFTKDGSSSYRIKSADGKTVSTKRDELSAICDHMNIQVDNPMNILTQDSARQFLAGSTPQDKYQFFLKGTQLTQLQEEYETCLENIGKTSRTLIRKREEIPELEKAFREADARNKEATKAREKQSLLVEYRRELAWAHVKAKQEELTKSIENVEKVRQRVIKIEEKIVESQGIVDSSEAVVSEITAEQAALPSVDSIRDELTQLKTTINRNKGNIRECKENEKEINSQMVAATKIIEDLEKEISKRAVEQDDIQLERERTQQQYENAKAELEGAEEEQRDIQSVPTQLSRRAHEAREEGKRVSSQVTHLQSEIDGINGNIQQCSRKDNDKFRLFGNRIQEVMAVVEKESWTGEKPVGPFGLYVEVKDQSWATVMRVQLGGLMTSWAVTNNRDRIKLRKILDHYENRESQIIVSDIDLFDYSQGEPPQEVITALRTLEIKHEFIKRILINQRNIERVILARTRAEGDRLLVGLGGGGLAWTADGMVVRRYADGGAQGTPMQNLRPQDPKQLMFRSSDSTAEIRRFEEEREEAERRLQSANAQVNEIRHRLRDLEQQLVNARSSEDAIRRRVHTLREEVQRLDGVLQVDAPVNVDFLEQSRNTQMEERDNLKESFRAVLERKTELEAVNLPLVTRREALEREIGEHQQKLHEIENRLADAMQTRLQATKDLRHYTDKLEEESKKVEELDELAKVVQAEFENWSEKAEEVGERVEKPRKPETIQRQIESVQKALQQHERQQGATPEQIAIEREDALQKLESHKKQCDDIHNLNKSLKNSLALRMTKWVQFRQHIALRCKYQFQYNLSTRGYYGKVIFDHNAGTLNLRVQTEDQAGTQAADKDPKALSGGEKSYSTICLLLALWESIQCPIRCLDEFDVFMDAANRRISMKLMLDTAQSSDKQYVLITPQDMSFLELAPNIKILRMNDPERGQSRLNF